MQLLMVHCTAVPCPSMLEAHKGFCIALHGRILHMHESAERQHACMLARRAAGAHDEQTCIAEKMQASPDAPHAGLWHH